MQKICFLDETTDLNALDDLKYSGRGGMVVSLRVLPDVLCQLGYDCYVISDIKKGGVTEAGTTWYTKGTMTADEKAREYDFLVYNRQTCDGFSEVKTKHRILWTHDVPHHGFIPDSRTINAFDATVFMSDYAERIWRKYFPTIGRSFYIPNGVAKTLFYPRLKDLNYIIFCSAPNRGLGKLSLIFEALKAKMPDRNLYLRAYSHMETLHPRDEDDYTDEYERAKMVGIDLRKTVPQTQLAEELGNASLIIIPTEYPEICSNTVLQALASGVPVITTGGIGSNREWVSHGHNGYLTEFQPCDYLICYLEMVRYAIDLLSNPRKHQKLIRQAPLSRGLYTWMEIGKKWHKMLKKIS